MAFERYDRGLELWPAWRPLLEELPWGWPWGTAPGRGAAWHPAVDVIDRPDEVVVEAELPGVDPDRIDIEVRDHELRIRGETRRETERTEGGIYRAERRYGAFIRSVALPADVDGDQARARYRRGVLEIHLPKRQEARRRIPVETGDEGS